MQLAAEKAVTEELRDSRLGFADTTDVTVSIATSKQPRGRKELGVPASPGPPLPTTLLGSEWSRPAWVFQRTKRACPGVRVTAGSELWLVGRTAADIVIWLPQGRLLAYLS